MGFALDLVDKMCLIALSNNTPQNSCAGDEPAFA